MELHEGQGQRPGEIPLTFQEDTLPRHQHVVEDREALQQVMPGAHRMMEGVVIGMAERTDDQLEPFGVHRDGERHGIVAIFRAQCARGDDQQLVRAHGVSGVRLGTAHDDAVPGFVDDAYIIVGVLLLVGMERAVPFDIRLRHGHGEVVVAAVLVVAHDAVVIIGAVLVIDALADHVHGEQAVGADLLDDEKKRPANAGAKIDDVATPEQILGVLWDLEVAAETLLTAGRSVGQQVEMLWVFAELVFESGMLDGGFEQRMCRHVRDALAPIVHCASILQAFDIGLFAARGHGIAPLLPVALYIG
jgi:hypothetical protein